MTKIIINFVFFSLIIFLSGCQNPENINSYVTKKYQDEKLNGNVLVIKDGKKLYEKSFGYSVSSKNEFLTKDYRFGIGSIYKEFPAVAIMQLNEKGLLSLDDKISDYINNFPEWSHEISIKHLLQYSSGLPMIKWDEYFGKGLSINDLTITDNLMNITQLEFKSGTDYLYTNNSPFLLKKIVETISGQEFEQYANENLFVPFNMKNTIIKKQYPYIDQTLIAIPFNSNLVEDRYSLEVSGMLFTSTSQDIYNWFHNLDSFKIISEKSLKFLSEKVKENQEFESPLGQVTWENQELIEHTHHGSMANYECIVRNFKKERVSIIILTNQKNNNVYDISERIFELIKRDYD